MSPPSILSPDSCQESEPKNVQMQMSYFSLALLLTCYQYAALVEQIPLTAQRSFGDWKSASSCILLVTPAVSLQANACDQAHSKPNIDVAYKLPVLPPSSISHALLQECETRFNLLRTMSTYQVAIPLINHSKNQPVVCIRPNPLSIIFSAES